MLLTTTYRACPLRSRTLIALLSPFLLVACGEDTSRAPAASTPVSGEAAGPNASAASEPASSPRAANFEVRFMTMMIDHQAMAVHMKDPVCGMQVDERSAAAQAEHQGKRYYFCSAGCQKKFQQNPAAYAGKA